MPYLKGKIKHYKKDRPTQRLLDYKCNLLNILSFLFKILKNITEIYKCSFIFSKYYSLGMCIDQIRIIKRFTGFHTLSLKQEYNYSNYGWLNKKKR